VTDDQIDVVQLSFRQVMRDRETTAELFYERLFELDPSLRALFHGDMAEQRRKFMVTLSVVVGSLRYLDDLTPSIAALARRHVRYGARPEHFSSFGAALLSALETGLGDAYTLEVEAAWMAVYDVLARMMQAAMSQTALLRAA